MPISWQEASDLARLSAFAYDVGQHIDDLIDANSQLTASGWRYLTPAELGLSASFFDINGYFTGSNGAVGFAAYNPETDQVAIVFKGTADPFDLVISDGAILTGLDLMPSIIGSFSELILAVSEFVTDEESPGYQAEVFAAGHSLGGAIAEYMWLNYSWVDGGIGIGSPGVEGFQTDPNPSDFLHIAREQDRVGQFRDEHHGGVTFNIDDYEFAQWVDALPAHDRYRYADQLQAIALSPLRNYIAPTTTVAFLENDQSNVVNVALGLGHGVDPVIWGGWLDDEIAAATFGSSVIVEGGGGVDHITGTAFDDWLSGGSSGDTFAGGGGADMLWGGTGGDHLEGGADNDTLIGGFNGDFYSFDLNQGYDVVNDQGGLGAGQDAIDFYCGATFEVIDFNWFSRDGADLLVRAYDSSNNLVLDLRIQNMGSNAGQIELFNLYAGDGTTLTQDWNLVNVWAQLAQPTSPPTPPPAPSPPPPPSSPSETEIVLTSNNDSWGGLSTAEEVWALAGSDSVSTGQGNDTIWGGDGNDTLSGGDGVDILIGDDNAAQGGSDSLYGDAGNDLLSGEAGNDSLSGGADNDTLLGGLGDDFLHAGTGADWVDGGAGTDAAIIDASSATEDLNFLASSAASSGGLTLANGVHVRNVEAIQLTTGAGDDLATFNLGLTASVYLAYNFWNAGAGTDRLTVDLSSASQAVYLDLTNSNNGSGYMRLGGVQQLSFTGVEAVTVTGGSQGDELYATDSGDDNLFGNAGNDNMNGRGGDDTVDGGDGDDALYGEAGDDILIGGSGIDFLHAGTGADWVDGGAGTDAAIIDASSATEDLNFLASSAASSGGLTLANGVHVRNVEAIQLTTGAGDDLATFNLGLTASVYLAYNFWNAGAGTDRLTVDLSSASQAVYLDLTNSNNGSGYMRLGGVQQLSFTGVEAVTVTGGSQGDELYATDSGDDNLFGNAGNDNMNGRGGDDTVDGGDGDDALYGEAGDDILIGGAGADMMAGGLDNDTYVRNNTGDVITELSGQGVDTVQSSLTYTLGANIENLTLTGVAAITGYGNVLNNTITGNGAANFLYGFDGADALDGGGGADQMFGGLGDDAYVVDVAGDVTSEASALGGTDTVFSSVTRNLTANIENLTLTGPAAITGAGNALNNVITGNTGANTLYGFDGNDRVDGGLGADTLFGANGNDVYVVDDVNDITVEGSPTGGTDTVESSISRNLNANFENLILTSTAQFGYGNILNNVMTGNAAANGLYGFDGNDTLDGGAGADQMFGANGDDTYIVDNAGDVTSEVSALGGIDTVISSVTRNLTANLENLTLIASADITGAGNALNNVITGNSGVNTLYGLDGNDTLDGGLGADVLQGGLGADTYVFTSAIGGGNVDAIVGFNVADDTFLLNNTIFTGLSAGALDAGAFVIGAAAGDADDRIIYNSATGQLYFDADGNDVGAAILFATLAPGLALTSADFIIGGP